MASSSFDPDTQTTDVLYQPSSADPASGAHGIAEMDDAYSADIEAVQSGVIDVLGRVQDRAWLADWQVRKGQRAIGSDGSRLQCTVAGTTGSTQPTWPTTIGGTVTDGTVTWQSMWAPAGIATTANVLAKAGGTMTGPLISPGITLNDRTSASNVAIRLAQTENKIYVSRAATASDSNDGLSPGSPKATIAGALSALGSNPGTVQLLYGTWSITSQIMVEGLTGLKIAGLGKYLTALTPTSALSGQSMLKFVACYIVHVENMAINGTGVTNDTFCPIEATAQSGNATTSSRLTLRDVVFDGGATARSIQHAVRWSLNGTGTTPNTANDLNNDQAAFYNVEFRNTNSAALSIEHWNSEQHIFTSCRFMSCGGVATFTGGSATFDSPVIDGTAPTSGAFLWDFQPCIGAGSPRYTHGTNVKNPQCEAVGYGIVRNQSSNTDDVVLFGIDGGDLGVAGGGIPVNLIEWDAASTSDNILSFNQVNLDQNEPGLVCNIASAGAVVSFRDSNLGVATYNNNATLVFDGVHHTVSTVTMNNTGALIEEAVVGGGRSTGAQLVNGAAQAVTSEAFTAARGLKTATTLYETSTTARALPGAGDLLVIKAPWLKAATISEFAAVVGAAGTGLTNCYFCAYDQNGNLLVYTADQSTAFETTSPATKTAGAANGPSSGLSIPAQSHGFIWLGILIGAATTLPTFSGNAPFQPNGINCGYANVGSVVPPTTLPSLTANALFPFIAVY